MNYFKEQREYLKDNKEGYWFKRKLYGWGWTPARPQGWVVILIYIVGVIFLSLHADKNSQGIEVFYTTILPVIILTVLLVAICVLKGEKPKWQWGRDRVNKN